MIFKNWYLDNNEWYYTLRTRSDKWFHPEISLDKKRRNIIPTIQLYTTTDEYEDGQYYWMSYFKWFGLSIFLPVGLSKKTGSIMYGIDSNHNQLHVYLGKRFGSKTIDLPFLWIEQVTTQVLSLDKKEIVFDSAEYNNHSPGDFFKLRDEASAPHTLRLPYTYTRINGEVQKVEASVRIHRWIGKRKWTPFRVIRDSIWVDFSEPIGEGVNTWKGGVYATGHDLLPNETAEECLRRMETERIFKA